ncbi:ribosomal RNA-processing protein 7-domain-containing protein [Mycena floridula]|nr:ribosomal RNA-processing protein 7-domain-containing protein [Mycena floridula]
MILNGFTVLPITYSATSTHYIYARSHTGSSKSGSNPWPNGRTLFLVNVPPDATEREIILLFKPHGTVERVSFDLDAADPLYDEQLASDSDEEIEEEEALDGAEDEQPRKRRKVAKLVAPKIIPLPTTPLRTLRNSGRSAHVVFLDSSSLDRCLNSSEKARPWPESEEPSGLSHYLSQFDSLRPPLDLVKEHADSAVALFDFEQAKAKQKSKYRKGEAIVDEDGFTLVTRGGAYGQTLGGGVTVASKRFQQTGQTSKRKRNKKDGVEKTGFYGFQKAEKQRNHLLDLKRKWEDDKAKIEKLRASRRFNPY